MTTDNQQAILLSVVIPCYKEARTLPLLYERLLRVLTEIGEDYEIIFVDSGSPDETPKVLADLAGGDRHISVVRHTRAFGPEAAFLSGMRVATGDAVILMDGDLQDPPEVISEFVARWREGYEVVYGQRPTRGGALTMNMARKGFYRIFKRLSYISIPLDAGDFSLLDRRVVDTLAALPEKHRFGRGLRAYVGYRQTAVPYHRPDRMFGASSNNTLSNLGWARRGIVSFSYLPLDLIGWVGLITTLLSLLVIAIEVALKIASPSSAPKGFVTLIVAILLVGGVQMLCLSVLASYMAHMYEEIKGRPTYIVDYILNPPAQRRRQPPSGPRLIELPSVEEQGERVEEPKPRTSDVA